MSRDEAKETLNEFSKLLKQWECIKYIVFLGTESNIRGENKIEKWKNRLCPQIRNVAGSPNLSLDSGNLSIPRK